MIHGIANGVQDRELWKYIQLHMPNWPLTCLADEGVTYEVFQMWLYENNAIWLQSKNAIVFVLRKQQRHVAEVHLCLQPQRLQPLMMELAEMMMWLFAMGWKRIEIPVTQNAGHSIRRVLQMMGFELEGIMKAKQHGYCRAEGRKAFMDVEMWAIVDKEKDDGQLSQ